MSKVLFFSCILIMLSYESQSQAKYDFTKITNHTMELVAKDFGGSIFLSEMCFRTVRNYVKKPFLNDFFSDTTYVMRNFNENENDDSCFCDYSSTLPGDEQKTGEYILFLSPYYDNAIIARVAKKSAIVYHDNQFSATGTNYFYLLKYSKSGEVTKYKRNQLWID